LHVHSTYSDGTCTVEQLALRAGRAGISIMALTDHDTVDGWESFRKSCSRWSVRPISGVELSAKHSRTVHILGYRIRRFEPLEEALTWTRSRRDMRNALMIERLNARGIPIAMEDVKRHASGKVVTRPHFAMALVERGYARDVPSAFSEFLGRGGLVYVPREGLSPSGCVDAIREAEGLSALAHPSLTGLDEDELGDLLEDLKKHGLWGLECISSHCSSEESYKYLSIADKYSLFPTAGSDFHGSVRPNAALGVRVSDDFLPWARLGVIL
jgi:predicted metal-dependent phosphoesterase TrpH